MRCATIVSPVIGEIDEGSALASGVVPDCGSGNTCGQIQQRLCTDSGSTLSGRAIAQFTGGVAAGNVFYCLFCSEAGCHYFQVASGSERIPSPPASRKSTNDDAGWAKGVLRRPLCQG